MDNKRKYCQIKYYLNNRYLGVSYVKESSDHFERIAAAKKVGILYYNGFLINGRDLRMWRILDNKGKSRKDIDFVCIKRTAKLHLAFSVNK